MAMPATRRFAAETCTWQTGTEWQAGQRTVAQTRLGSVGWQWSTFPGGQRAGCYMIWTVLLTISA
jgi:hypothetical protein